MSTATVTDAVPEAPRPGKKKLIIMVAAALLLVALAGSGVVLLLKKRAQAALEAEGLDVAPAMAAVEPEEPKVPPVFVPLDPFTVNLADRQAERYAQIGITLAVADSKATESVKLYMPAIRNNILMVLAHKNSSDLLQRDGKDQLADEVLRESLRALGHKVADAAPANAEAAGTSRRKLDTRDLPVRAVYFSTFIVQ